MPCRKYPAQSAQKTKEKVRTCCGNENQKEFHLNWLLKVNVESVAGTVREEFSVVLGQHAPESFQLDADAIVGRTVGRAVEAEPNNEDALVHAELDRIASATVTPLVAPIG